MIRKKGIDKNKILDWKGLNLNSCRKIIQVIFMFILLILLSGSSKKVSAMEHIRYTYSNSSTYSDNEDDTVTDEDNVLTDEENVLTDQDIDDYTNEFDYSEIQSVINEALDGNQGFDFGDYVGKLITGKEPFSFKGLLNQLKNGILGEIQGNINIIVELIGLAVVAAIFTNFSGMFKNTQISETGFYVTYLLLFTILTASFYQTSLIAVNTLEHVLDFMKVLIPTYFLSIAFAAGAKTSLVFYESTLFIITLVDYLLIKLILPMINIYMLINLANNLSKEDLLSKLEDLFDTVISGVLKGLLAFVIGINTIQGFIVPVADSVKNSVFLKAASAIPGVGNSFDAVTKTVLGAGVLVKNSIGVAGLFVIILICAVPVMKLLLITFIYKLGAAVVQPISDKRIINCINGTSKAIDLLFRTVTVGAILFLLTITLIIASTNLKLR